MWEEVVGVGGRRWVGVGCRCRVNQNVLNHFRLCKLKTLMPMTPCVSTCVGVGAHVGAYVCVCVCLCVIWPANFVIASY